MFLCQSYAICFVPSEAVAAENFPETKMCSATLPSVPISQLNKVTLILQPQLFGLSQQIM